MKPHTPMDWSGVCYPPLGQGRWTEPARC